MTKTLKAELVGTVVGLVTAVRPVVTVIGRRDRALEVQIRRALNSVGLNVAEAFGAQRGNSRVRLETARGSLFEVWAGLQLAVAWGHVPARDIEEVGREIDRLGGRLFGLVKLR